ncbi:MAG TPA: SIMPL domain-containing protein, partial [Chloroflexota bacterium]|nr:SIMPL domain-containing protein [Chloroflexota bacterium]
DDIPRLLTLVAAGALAGALLTGCAIDRPALAPAATATPVAAAVLPAPASTGARPAAAVRAAPVQVQSVVAANPAPPVSGSTHGITVTGQGRIQARPDQATIETGVQTQATTAREAQAANNRAMQAVISAIKAAGIPDRDIQTSGLSLSPIIGENQTVQGYRAVNNVTVRIENIDQTGAVLDAAIQAGANMAGSVRFGFKDETSLRNQALAAAAADARSKAAALASALGLQISGIESVVEGTVSIPIPLAAPRAVASASEAVPVEPGEQTITAQVTVVFSY